MKLIDRKTSSLALEKLMLDPAFDVRSFLEMHDGLNPASWLELESCLRDFAERGEADTGMIERSIGEATEFVDFYETNFVHGAATDPFKRPDAGEDRAETVVDETFRNRVGDETEVQGGDGKAGEPRKISNGYDRYHIFCKIGGGGQSEVFGARDVEVKRVVAIKSPRLKEFRNLSEGGQRDICRRFVQEAYVTGQLKHQSIIPIYALDYGIVDERLYSWLTHGIPFLVLPYYPNGVLKNSIKNFNAGAVTDAASSQARELKFREMISAVVQVCKAVAHAHERGFIHRDIKPDNVLTGHHGEVYLSDWGLARTIRQEKAQNQPSGEGGISLDLDDTREEDGVLYGTIPFMSPEQAKGQASLHNERTDIFLLGATLYAIVYANPPFRTTSRDESLRKAMNCEIDFAGEHTRFADSGLVAICRMAMNREQSERYQTAMDLASDLERWLADQPLLYATESRRRKAARFIKRHSRTLAAASVVLMAGTTGLLIHNFNISAARDVAVQARDEANKAKEAEQAASRVASRERDIAQANLATAIDSITKTLDLIVKELPKIPGVEGIRLKICDSISTTTAELARNNRDRLIPFIEAKTHREAGNINRLTGKYAESKARYEKGLAVLDDLSRRVPEKDGFAISVSLLKCQILWDYSTLSRLFGHYDDASQLMADADRIVPSILNKPIEKSKKTQVVLVRNVYFGELLAETGSDDALAKVIAQNDALLQSGPVQSKGLETLPAEQRILAINLRAGHHQRAKRFDRSITDYETILAILKDEIQKKNAPSPNGLANAKEDTDTRMILANTNYNLASALGEKDDPEATARAAALFESAWKEFGELIEDAPGTLVHYDDRLSCFVEMRAFERRRKHRFDSLFNAVDKNKFDFELALRDADQLIELSGSPDLLDLRARILSEKAHREPDPQKRAELARQAIVHIDAAIKKLPNKIDFGNHRESISELLKK